MHIQHSLVAVLSASKDHPWGGRMGDSLISLERTILSKSKTKYISLVLKEKGRKTTVTPRTTHFKHPVLHVGADRCLPARGG